jgi:hypothetical protein
MGAEDLIDFDDDPIDVEPCLTRDAVKLLTPENASFSDLRPTRDIVGFNVPIDQALNSDSWLEPGQSSKNIFVHTNADIAEITNEETDFVLQIVNTELRRHMPPVRDPNYAPFSGEFQQYEYDSEQDFAFGRTLWAWILTTRAYTLEGLSSYMNILRTRAPNWRLRASAGWTNRETLVIYSDAVRIGTELFAPGDGLEKPLAEWAKEVEAYSSEA